MLDERCKERGQPPDFKSGGCFYARLGQGAHVIGRMRWRGGRAREIGLSIVLGVQIANMFVVAPLAATGYLPLVIADCFRITLAAAAAYLLTERKLAFWIISLSLATSLLLSIVLRTGIGAVAVSLERLAATTAFDVTIVIVVARVVFSSGKVNVHRIMGAVILYLSTRLIFANIYRAAALLLHPSFSSLPHDRANALSQMLYFSLSTLTTTGFGDITPIHPFVRSLANLEAVIGQLFPATLLARLVTLHATGSNLSAADGESGAEPGTKRSSES